MKSSRKRKENLKNVEMKIQMLESFRKTKVIFKCWNLNVKNYKFLTTETNSKASYIYFIVFNINSSVKLLEVTVQIFCLQNFVYNCVFGKMKKNSMKPFTSFHILKMKAHLEKKIWISIEKSTYKKKRLSMNMSVWQHRLKNENQPCPKISITD